MNILLCQSVKWS